MPQPSPDKIRQVLAHTHEIFLQTGSLYGSLFTLQSNFPMENLSGRSQQLTRFDGDEPALPEWQALASEALQSLSCANRYHNHAASGLLAAGRNTGRLADRHFPNARDALALDLARLDENLRSAHEHLMFEYIPVLNRMKENDPENHEVSTVAGAARDVCRAYEEVMPSLRQLRQAFPAPTVALE